MSSLTNQIYKRMVTVNPLNITSLAVVVDTKKDCRDSERERRQTEMVTVAPAWQLMSSQFNHRMGSWGS